jgi:pseudaminic acid biosynthesis-associated methylase
MTNDPAKTPQEALWRGQFGDEYIGRSQPDDQVMAARINYWSRILKGTEGDPPRSILEVGSNIGLNLRAIRKLTSADIYAVEPNALARETLVKDGVAPADRVMEGVASRIALPDASVDLAFTNGVLIHIHPDDLLASCREIHRVAKRYIVCSEYFADSALFKRDFGGFWLDNFPDLVLLDYGFAWKRVTGLDNPTWWLFAKR